MPSDKDIIIAAREFNTDISACGIDPQRAHEVIDELVGEVEQLRQANAELERCDMCSRLTIRRLCRYIEELNHHDYRG